jgi:hypothetical protein
MLNYDNVVDTVLHNALEENAWTEIGGNQTDFPPA